MLLAKIFLVFYLFKDVGHFLWCLYSNKISNMSESNFTACQNSVSEHSFEGVPASLDNLTKSVPGPFKQCTTSDENTIRARNYFTLVWSIQQGIDQISLISIGWRQALNLKGTTGVWQCISQSP